MIIDTHAHLIDTKFDNDRKETLQRAFEAGVSIIFEIACEMPIWDKSLEFSKNDNIYVAFGIHPHEAKHATDEDLKKLENIVQTEKCIAVGEIGLDYHYDLSPRDMQRELFIKQLDIAVKYNKPVIIHCRSAYEEMITLLKKYGNFPKGVLHCYSGTPEEAKIYTQMGFLLGIDGPVTFPKSDKLRQVVEETDITKLLVETDCPYLAPQKYRGKRNEPAYITETIQEIANVKGISFEEAAKITTANALKLFKIGEKE